MIQLFIFFFQAEDGIRDTSVTGVQTGALPIWLEADMPVVDKKPKYPRPDLVERLFGAFGKALVSERLTLDGLLSVWHPNL